VARPVKIASSRKIVSPTDEKSVMASTLQKALSAVSK
jgi:hypothetical protein